ncbi:prepilin-type N-terminal cleavage/methylation domain-containing protein [Anoxynatronum sibiricum]|uniref:Prepilin-type N-terminal cleavage/methylation domain-containing protein n=1 Tax=Anoxynatronum sibiricum TaxID=210623 RepID=A0ABU9VQ50_9CLOT
MTLIEVMISLALISLLLLVTYTGSLFVFSHHRQQSHQFKEEQNLRQAMDAIEKRFREMNQQEITFHPAQQSFKSRVPRTDFPGMTTVWIDFSGINRNRLNTWLYFDRTSGTLRVNKNNEHNVLYTGIEDILITEVISGKLVEITLIGQRVNREQTLTLKLSYGCDDS